MGSIILCSAILATQQTLAVAALLFGNIPTQHVSIEKKKQREATPYKCNVALCSVPPETMLEPVCILDGLLIMTFINTSRKLLICTPGNSSFLLTTSNLSKLVSHQSMIIISQLY
jgi:hypothetical protein